jgi:hypothetical protein
MAAMSWSGNLSLSSAVSQAATRTFNLMEKRCRFDGDYHSRARAILQARPILLMTGSMEPIQGDPEAFVKKPVAKEELLDAIERALGSVRASE